MSLLGKLPAELQTALVKILVDEVYRKRLETQLTAEIERLVGQSIKGVELHFITTGALALDIALLPQSIPEAQRSHFPQTVQTFIEQLIGIPALPSQARYHEGAQKGRTYLLIELVPASAAGADTEEDELTDLELELVSGGSGSQYCCGPAFCGQDCPK